MRRSRRDKKVRIVSVIIVAVIVVAMVIGMIAPLL